MTSSKNYKTYRDDLQQKMILLPEFSVKGVNAFDDSLQW